MGVRPTFMGFESATRGLMLNQKALDIVGNNLTNIGVTGYTRQRVDLVSLNMNTKFSRYSQNTTSLAGQGGTVYGVSQIRDSFLDKRFREEYADVGYYETASSILENLSASLDEITPSTMSTAMQKFQNAWNELLAAGADEKTGAANLYAGATQIVQIFRTMSSKLDELWAQEQYNLSLDVEDINSILQNIAVLNDEIKSQRFNALDPENDQYGPLELQDQRNVLLDQLAAYSDITYREEADGTITVWMGTKSDDNPPVVQGVEHDKIMMQVNDNDPNFKTVKLSFNSTGKELNLSTGSLRASTDMLNGRGLAMNGSNGETYTEGILYFKDKIDTFASTFAQAFNNVIEYVDDAGSAYDPPRYKALFTFESDSYYGASSLKISEEWIADSSYITKNVLHKIEPDDEDGGGGDSENTYAAKAYKLFESTLDFGEFKGTISEYITFYSVTKLANNKEYIDTCWEASATVSDNLLNDIQGISGVSMEEEGVDMMMYQKAYDAVSRLFTTLDEMLDKLINGTGTVGL